MVIHFLCGCYRLSIENVCENVSMHCILVVANSCTSYEHLPFKIVAPEDPMSVDKNQGGRKKQESNSDNVWKSVIQTLSAKKKEGAVKSGANSHIDFSSFEAQLQEITEQLKKNKTYEEFIKTETKNSLLYAPLFEELETQFSNNAKVEVPAFFPKGQFYQFSNPVFYKKLDLDTLFFIFYFCKGTIQQTYAAMQLKKYAWRYHLKYKMWFQRLDEPKLITSEYEKGEFLFFDYETAWNFMKKNDFIFEYYYLEQNDFY
ncbi:CCR4-NOT transcription complex subunit 3 [Enteropsectra breve]|nr:CCR4-NOT transcription complex subunit 3 [Enteropsectra breve]